MVKTNVTSVVVTEGRLVTQRIINVFVTLILSGC